MPYINISLFEGQPHDRKVRIAERISDVIREEMQVPDPNIWVTFTDIPKSEWSIGGKMCGEKQ